jgi:hypothetical protein
MDSILQVIGAVLAQGDSLREPQSPLPAVTRLVLAYGNPTVRYFVRLGFPRGVDFAISRVAFECQRRCTKLSIIESAGLPKPADCVEKLWRNIGRLWVEAN